MLLIKIAEQTTRAIEASAVAIKDDIKSKELATKGDVRESELRLQKEIETVKSDLRKDIASTKIQTLVWMGINSAFLLGVMAKGFHWW